MEKRRLYLLSALLAFALGLALASAPADSILKAGLTGAAIQIDQNDSSKGTSLGIVLICISLVFFSLTYHEMGKHEGRIRSFRKWMEKEGRRRIEFETAQKQYESIERIYLGAVRQEKINPKYVGKPMKFIESYATSSPKDKKKLFYSPN